MDPTDVTLVSESFEDGPLAHLFTSTGTLNAETITVLIWEHRAEPEFVEAFCETLAQFSDERACFDQIEYYLPQLAHMIIHLDVELSTLALERFAMVVCQQSIHFALQLNWIVVAAMQDYQPELPDGERNPQRNIKYFTRCARLLENIEKCVVFGTPEMERVERMYAAGQISDEDLEEQVSHAKSVHAQQIVASELGLHHATISGHLYYKRWRRRCCRPKRWKRRFFVIEHRVLYCFHNEGGELRRAIPLHNAEVQMVPNQRHDFYFEVHDKIGTRYLLYAESQEDLDRWVHVIRTEMKRAPTPVPEILEDAATAEQKDGAAAAELNSPDTNGDAQAHKNEHYGRGGKEEEEDQGTATESRRHHVGFSPTVDKHAQRGGLTLAQTTRYRFFTQERAFVQALTDISERMRFLEREHRRAALEEELTKLRLPPRAYLPLCNSTDLFRRVLGAVPQETRAFSTKARCPCLMIFEIEEDMNDTDVVTFLHRTLGAVDDPYAVVQELETPRPRDIGGKGVSRKVPAPDVIAALEDVDEVDVELETTPDSVATGGRSTEDSASASSKDVVNVHHVYSQSDTNVLRGRSPLAGASALTSPEQPTEESQRDHSTKRGNSNRRIRKHKSGRRKEPKKNSSTSTSKGSSKRRKKKSSSRRVRKATAEAQDADADDDATDTAPEVGTDVDHEDEDADTETTSAAGTDTSAGEETLTQLEAEHTFANDAETDEDSAGEEDEQDQQESDQTPQHAPVAHAASFSEGDVNSTHPPHPGRLEPHKSVDVPPSWTLRAGAEDPKTGDRKRSVEEREQQRTALKESLNTVARLATQSAEQRSAHTHKTSKARHGGKRFTAPSFHRRHKRTNSDSDTGHQSDTASSHRHMHGGPPLDGSPESQCVSADEGSGSAGNGRRNPRQASGHAHRHHRHRTHHHGAADLSGSGQQKSTPPGHANHHHRRNVSDDKSVGSSTDDNPERGDLAANGPGAFARRPRAGSEDWSRSRRWSADDGDDTTEGARASDLAAFQQRMREFSQKIRTRLRGSRSGADLDTTGIHTADGVAGGSAENKRTADGSGEAEGGNGSAQNGTGRGGHPKCGARTAPPRQSLVWRQTNTGRRRFVTSDALAKLHFPKPKMPKLTTRRHSIAHHGSNGGRAGAHAGVGIGVDGCNDNGTDSGPVTLGELETELACQCRASNGTAPSKPQHRAVGRAALHRSSSPHVVLSSEFALAMAEDPQASEEADLSHMNGAGEDGTEKLGEEGTEQPTPLDTIEETRPGSSNSNSDSNSNGNSVRATSERGDLVSPVELTTSATGNADKADAVDTGAGVGLELQVVGTSADSQREAEAEADAGAITNANANAQTKWRRSKPSDTAISADVLVRAENILSYGESWPMKKQRIHESSPQGSLPGWELSGLISKSNDDLRQEVFVMQLIIFYERVFREAELPTWLFTYRILSTSKDTGLIQLIPDAISIDALKKREDWPGTLRGHFINTYGPADSDEFRRAQRRFMESLAAYSIVCYLLAIKDRHNGNIMINAEGRLVHIDFGFVFGIAPGNAFSFERAPFKLTPEMVELLDGVGSPVFEDFIDLCTDTFEVAREHERIVTTLMEIMIFHSNYPCFHKYQVSENPRPIQDFRSRMRLDITDPDRVRDHVATLVARSTDSRGTYLYDQFQLMTNGLAP